MPPQLTHKRLDRKVLVPAFAAYAFSVQFGNFFRLSDAEIVPGLSTLIGLFIIAIGIFRVINGFINDVILQAFMLLLGWLCISSMFSPTDPISAYKLLANFAGYVMLTAVVSRTYVDAAQFRFIWIAIAGGMAISAGLTIVDYIGLINVPRNNEVVISSEVGSSEIEQATGFFPRRSAMAAVFSTGIAGSILIGILAKGIYTKIWFWSCGLVGALCVLLTHNRSGVLAPLMAIAVYSMFFMRGALSKKVMIAVAGFTSAALIIAVMAFYFPEHLEVYEAKLGHLLPGGEDNAQRNVAKSDYGRIRLFLAALSSLSENPTGHGFGLVKLTQYTFKGSHNVITGFIWAGGIMFILWLPFFVWIVFQRLRNVASVALSSLSAPYYEATLCGLFAFLLNNMAHESWRTGVAWILFGTVICNIGYSSRRNLDVSKMNETDSD